MYQKDLVTIVVPAYNVEMFLKENIESILGQTYKNLEIIYVCDGCTDNSVGILRQYTDDNRLKVFVEEENHGAAVSRNIGMNMAKGDWIIFLDADDLYESNMIEEMVESAVGTSADMCCCYCEYFDDVPNNKAHITNEMQKLYCSTYPIIETEKEFRHIFQIVEKGPCTKLIHKSVYMRDEVYFQDIPNANDVYYSLVAAMNTHRIVYVDKVFWHYRSDKGRNTLSSERNLKRNYVLEAYDKIYEYILCQKNSRNLVCSFYNDICSHVYLYLNQPVSSYLIVMLKNVYFEKWGMYERNVYNELNWINRIIYERLLSDNGANSFNHLVMQAKINFIEKISQSGCSIWGTGLLGSELLQKISQTDIKIQHVFDSSHDKWGKEIYGYFIENFDEIEVDNIIVTTPKYFDEIREQIGKRAKNIYNLEQEIWRIP